ncbi:elongation of very long chain fatty acids protein AAEL008004 [Schistocerca piceifrons]|uniref:elongation of very long chain fatty acids protein AAEL008004 n=1 Tax=Schistocerca piceifrons TaxID=274613 RepID=UPI001F5F60AA|nr:elongation of very long chain fatty acids protein AAEL008004 [Schistocerca piceifrons]
MAANVTGLTGFVEGYRNFMETKSDPRTKDWFLVTSPAPLITLLVSYLYFVTSVGPRFMRDRKPYDLKAVLMVYNFAQVIISTWLVWEGLQAGWLHHYSFKCQPVDYSDNPLALRMARAVWWYFMCKLVELLDTVFFVLRKKNNQVSYLHLWHHTLMPVCAWIGCRFLPGGHGTLLGLINSFVHIIMYSYYLLASLGPQYQKYLWWKKYLTTLQMVQFVIVFLHNIQLLIYDCNYPKAIVVLLGVNALYFLYLFGSFYRRTYKKQQKQQ